MTPDTISLGASTDFEAPNGYDALRFVTLNLCLVSVVLSVVMLLATTLPLFFVERRKCYSTYNLYLGLMAIPDLATNLYVLYLFLVFEIAANSSSGAEQLDDDWSQELKMTAPANGFLFMCLETNLYLNTFLLYELYWLLQSCNQRKRHQPPSIKRVCLQALISSIVGTAHSYVECLALIKWNWVGWNSVLYTTCATWGLPGLITLYACFRIHKEGLINTSTMGAYQGRLYVLTTYIRRIVMITFVLWLPSSILFGMSWTIEDKKKIRADFFGANISIMTLQIGIIIVLSQSILSFWLAMRKPDVSALVRGLFKCEICCSWSDSKECCEESIEVPEGNTDEENIIEDSFLINSFSRCTGSSELKFSLRRSSASLGLILPKYISPLEDLTPPGTDDSTSKTITKETYHSKTDPVGRSDRTSITTPIHWSNRSIDDISISECDSEASEEYSE